MTLTERLKADFAFYGLTNHPLAQGLPGIVAAYQQERRSSRRWVLCCTLLTGLLLGGGGSLWVMWQQIDAIRGSSESMAASCLNPRVESKTNKAQAQVGAQRKEDARRGGE